MTKYFLQGAQYLLPTSLEEMQIAAVCNIIKRAHIY